MQLKIYLLVLPVLIKEMITVFAMIAHIKRLITMLLHLDSSLKYQIKILKKENIISFVISISASLFRLQRSNNSNEYQVGYLNYIKWNKCAK